MNYKHKRKQAAKKRKNLRSIEAPYANQIVEAPYATEVNESSPSNPHWAK